MIKKWISRSRDERTVFLLSLFFLVYSIYEFYYIFDLYSCGRLNLCMSHELSLSLSQIFILQSIKIISAIGILFSRFRITSLGFLWITNVLFMLANRYVHSPEQPFLNFLILVLILNFWSKSKVVDPSETTKNKYLNYSFVYSIIFYLAYSYSGFTKFNTESWLSGQFLFGFLEMNHLVTGTIIPSLWPTWILKGLTYFVVFIEFFSFLSLFNRLLGLFFWTGLTLMQVGLLLTTDLWQVSLGMLICHFYVLDLTIFNKMNYFRQTP